LNGERSLERLHHGIVKCGPYLLDKLRTAIRPGAVGQQCDRELALRINPERGAGIAQMAKGADREVLAGLRRLRWSVPAQRIRCACGRTLTPGEKFHGLWLYQRTSTTQHAF